MRPILLLATCIQLALLALATNALAQKPNCNGVIVESGPGAICGCGGQCAPSQQNRATSASGVSVPNYQRQGSGSSKQLNLQQFNQSNVQVNASIDRQRSQERNELDARTNALEQRYLSALEADNKRLQEENDQLKNQKQIYISGQISASDKAASHANAQSNNQNKGRNSGSKGGSGGSGQQMGSDGKPCDPLVSRPECVKREAVGGGEPPAIGSIDSRRGCAFLIYTKEGGVHQPGVTYCHNGDTYSCVMKSISSDKSSGIYGWNQTKGSCSRWPSPEVAEKNLWNIRRPVISLDDN